MGELGVADTNGILALPWVRPERTSAGLGWERLYVSKQHERPYRAEFGAAGSHQLILHLAGPVTVHRGVGTPRARSHRIPAGGLFLQPAHGELSVELGGALETVHVYVADAAVQEAAGEPVELAEEHGTIDPLLEQLVLSLDGVVRDWEPSARTYADQLGALVAAQLAHRHRTSRPAPVRESPAAALSDRQFTRVRELLAERLAEPVPLAEMAGTAGLSVSQFARRFKARAGVPPHRFLLRLRLEQASLLLRTGTAPIADIAVRCGFTHQEHLTRVMRAQLGTTPAALRRGT